MGNNTKPCVVCGKEYKLCRKCEEMKLNGTVFWRASCDTRECFSVLLILNDYFYHHISKEDARSLLSNYLNDDMLPYKETSRKLIEEIYADDIVLDESIINESVIDLVEPEISIAVVDPDIITTVSDYKTHDELEPESSYLVDQTQPESEDDDVYDYFSSDPCEP